MMKKKSKIGLTLVELLLAVSIFSIISATLYSIFFQGIKIWKNSEVYTEKGHEERIIIRKMSRDIRNSFIHSWIKFVGESSQIYFCGLRRPENEPDKNKIVLSKIHYYFINKNSYSDKKGLYLAEYPAEFTFAESPPKGKILTNIFHELHFEYGYWDPNEEKIVTKDIWLNPKIVPKIVVIKGITDKKLIKTVVIPFGEIPEYNENSFEDET